MQYWKNELTVIVLTESSVIIVIWLNSQIRSLRDHHEYLSWQQCCAGPTYEKEVEPYFFDLILGTTSSGREDKRGKELGGS
jgi:hypothetical protein